MDQYVMLLELRGKYLEKHPAIAAFETRLSAIKSDLVRELEIGQRNVELQYQTLTKQAGDLQTALDATTKQALTLETRTSEYNRLKRDFERLVRLSEQVGGRAQETNLASHLKTNNVRLLDAARTPGAPVSPNVPRAVLAAALLGLLLGIGLAIFLESLDNTVKNQDDLEKVAGVTFLGLVPSITFDENDDLAVVKANGRNGEGKHPHSKDLFVWTHPKSSVAECCRSIRTNLLFMSPDKPAQTLLITSAEPQEGKTTVAVNLAITLAQSGLSVLLVDTDMRRPRLHRAFGLPANPEGLSTAIVGETSVLSVIRETGIPNLSVLPCGACPPNPAELLHAERFSRIIEELRKHYDRIVFDSPPVRVVTDPTILARLTDGTIFVAKAGRTSRDSLARARRQVASDSRVNVLGCIINNLDLTKHRGYGAYYYYNYSRYGTHYGAEEKAARTGRPPDRRGSQLRRARIHRELVRNGRASITRRRCPKSARFSLTILCQSPEASTLLRSQMKAFSPAQSMNGPARSNSNGRTIRDGHGPSSRSPRCSQGASSRNTYRRTDEHPDCFGTISGNTNARWSRAAVMGTSAPAARASSWTRSHTELPAEVASSAASMSHNGFPVKPWRAAWTRTTYR